jgi:hypothetical protein
MTLNKVIRGQRKHHNKELHNLYYLPNIIRMTSFFWDTMPYSLLQAKQLLKEHVTVINSSCLVSCFAYPKSLIHS